MKESKMDDHELIARAVLVHRKKAGLSRRELSGLAQVAETSIYNLEKMKKGATLDTLLKLFHVLNIGLQLEGPFMAEVLGEEGGHA